MPKTHCFWFRVCEFVSRTILARRTTRQRRGASEFDHVGLFVIVLALAATSAHAAFFHKPYVAALKRETTQTNGDVAFVLGYYSIGDRGGGWFNWQPYITNADDGGRYIAPDNNSGTGRWVRV